MSRRTVLITGAAGNIGTVFARDAHDKYELRLTARDEDDLRPLAELGNTVAADIGDLDVMKRVCEGIDTVVHLAGDASPSATWESAHEANILGSYNIFIAAKHAGCRRVVYASSIHAVSGYPPDVQVRTDDPVNPGDIYGVTKCFGEALGRYMGEKEGLSTIAVRIGAFQPLEAARGDRGPAMLDYFVSERDLCQLLRRCIDADDNLAFAIVHGLSDNRFKRLDLTDTRRVVGYAPVDDAAELNAAVRDALPDEPPAANVSDADQESGIRDDV